MNPSQEDGQIEIFIRKGVGHAIDEIRMRVPDKPSIVSGGSKGAFTILVDVIGVARFRINPAINVTIKHAQRLAFDGITHVSPPSYSTCNDFFAYDIDHLVPIERKVEVCGPFQRSFCIDGT